MIRAAWTLSAYAVPESGGGTSDLHLWSGEGDLTYAGQDYEGVAQGAISAGQLGGEEYSLDSPRRRTTFQLFVGRADHRRRSLLSWPALRVETKRLLSQDGAPWMAVLESEWVVGRRTLTSLGWLTLELEDAVTAASRLAPAMWSDVEQRARTADDARGADTFFAHCRELEKGVKIQWRR